jgi:hypothetical protein
MDTIPVLLKAGTLVPMLDSAVETLVTTERTDVVDASDQGHILHVRGALSPRQAEAAFVLEDGTRLVVRWVGPSGNRAILNADAEAALDACERCYIEDRNPGVSSRVRGSLVGSGQVGPLSVEVSSSSIPRRIRWDIALLEQ